jgi:hypothetical protein
MGNQKTSRGFSIIELASTVIILGAIFIMTLKGSAIVTTMRAVVASYKLAQYQGLLKFYQAEYDALPGDDPRAPQRFGRPDAIFFLEGAPISSVDNNKIDGKLTDSLSPNGEQFMAWRDLRSARLIDGDPKIAGGAAMTDNPFGGVYGLDEGNLGQTGGSLCLTRVPGRAAEIIDKRIDDGVINKGKVVATSRFDPAVALNHFDAPDSEPYNLDKEYIICAPMLP